MSNFRSTLVAMTITALGAGYSLAAESQKEDNPANQVSSQQTIIKKTNDQKKLGGTQMNLSSPPTDYTCKAPDFGTTDQGEILEKLREISKTAQIFVPNFGNVEQPCRVPTNKHPMHFVGLK